MRLKVSYHRAGGSVVDVSITADGTATVGDVASALLAADPTSAVTDATGRTLVADSGAGAGEVPAGTLLVESGITSGSRVQVVEPSASYGSKGSGVAVLRVVSGPDEGQQFALPSGTSVVGRARDADIVLSDPLVSKRHARVNVGEAIEVMDLGSANGMLVSGDPVARAAVQPGEPVTIGDTSFVVLVQAGQATSAGAAPSVDIIRSPRVVARFPGEEIPSPQPPKPPEPSRFPYLAILAPILMGLVMYALTRQLIGVVMIALSPLLVVGAWVDGKVTSRRNQKAQAERFEEALDATRGMMNERHDREREVRVQEAPSLQEILDAATTRSPLLWTRRPEHFEFLAPRLGIATLPSRDVVVLPSTQDTEPRYWRSLLDLKAEYATIAQVPLLAELRLDGALGIAGDPGVRAGVARGVVTQVLGLHSPAEVVCAAIIPQPARPDWDWLDWMPHTASSHSPLGGETHLASSPGRASALLSRLEGLVEARGEGKPAALRGGIDPEREPDRTAPVVPSVLVLIEAGAPVDRARATRLAERGADVGVHVIWCARTVAQLPAACRVHLDVSSRDGVVAGRVRRGDVISEVAVESLDAATADAVARSLAAAVDAGVPVSDESDLPRTVSFVDLVGPEIVSESETVAERWRQSDSLAPKEGEPRPKRKVPSSLRAVVGHAGVEPFQLDLKTHGPHALVGGTTGSGKSEFLQSWVLGMAAAHAPDRVTFLFVDYKGGSAFADCVDLPHSVGLVTDLSPHLVRRALTSLRAELRFREHLLHRKGAKDLAELEKMRDPEAPPSLVIVVDEFAALVQEVPEFVDGVVDVAQRGRSLGLHLVLATQRPAGVIKDNLRANTNLRVALRMADTEDSTDVLGDPMSAHFDPGIPGRAAAKTGPGRITTFQAAYAGGHTGTEPPPPRIDIEERAFGPGEAWDVPEAPSSHKDDGPSDISRAVLVIRAAATGLELREPRKPWLPELASAYDLAKLPNPRVDQRLLLGVVDDPAAQAQPTVFYEPDEVGNLAIFGSGGSGKSTALRSIAVSAALTARGGPVQVYGIDFGASGLRMLNDLPHVGAIISGDDDERIVRLLRMLRDMVEERSARYSALSAGTITEYRAAANRPNEPRILLLIDGMSAFRDAYEFSHQSSWFGVFSQLAVDGRQVGVHVIVTGDRGNALPHSLSSTFQQRLVLRCATEDDYIMLGVPKDILDGTSSPGRAILGDNEMQFAVLGGNSSMSVQAQQIGRLAEAMRRQGVAEAPGVPKLPTEVPLEELPESHEGAPVIGLLDSTLGPATKPTTGAFMVAGSPQSGRTSAMLAMGRALKRANPGTHVAVLAPRADAMTRAGGWDDLATSPEGAAALAERLLTHVTSGRLAPGQLAILVSSVGDFGGTEAEMPVNDLVKAAVRAEQFAIGESESSAWSQAYTLSQPFKAAKRGLVLAPGEMDGDMLFSTPLGRVKRADFPPGRGFLIDAGRAQKVQVAWVR
ncbi:FtsK/SpoIIIE domain-containing protein [Demequina sp. NBRC 110054]|uniref:FtsK/SpoIIIE domain-containing protein n=1 Tax=Demequina sp. NBRC 110054 TaxID=1570343 RepID=UPI0009FF4EBB|nr:FtsK/SpoIIIE domain-containing protein [Demequina sp. NBRC 110054]